MYRLKAMSKFIKTVFAAVAVSLMLAGCGRHDAVNPSAFDAYFDMSIDGVPFKAQVAISDTEKMRGLMFRESLAENCGMVFVYQNPIKASFWMKNTLIPLDLAFFDKDGVLTEVKKLYPQNLDSVSSARADILYCIEMNSGWFERNKISSSAKLDMKKLVDAINARNSK